MVEKEECSGRRAMTGHLSQEATVACRQLGYTHYTGKLQDLVHIDIVGLYKFSI